MVLPDHHLILLLCPIFQESQPSFVVKWLFILGNYSMNLSTIHMQRWMPHLSSIMTITISVIILKIVANWGQLHFHIFHLVLSLPSVETGTNIIPPSRMLNIKPDSLHISNQGPLLPGGDLENNTGKTHAVKKWNSRHQFQL